ncbi:hypothetical protein BDN70DRAFT_873222 [Pholiota conissans]|uniref:Nucleolar protein 16 n=1 Tax=Pholiota conissans TaxID=109636 RepID=A0A9P5ZBT8_9AGAR|nr:hypothetical protein BDN70DRAFT_873222 [Pholiota conissans]
MANPRQRRKARSGTHRPVSHSLHAKKNLKKTTIRGPKALQDAWDKKLTVRQNYANLGLVVTLDPSAHGGVEKQLGVGSSTQSSQRQQPDASSSSSAQKPTANVSTGFGRIIRDAEGKVIGVEMDEEEETQPISMDLEEDLDSRVDPSVREKWSKDFSRSTAPSMGPVNESLVHKLEEIAASATGTTTLSVPLSGIGSRHVSTGEIKYLDKLVKKYGNNIEGMAGDVKLNPEQRTVGQLRRALKKAKLL